MAQNTSLSSITITDIDNLISDFSDKPNLLSLSNDIKILRDVLKMVHDMYSELKAEIPNIKQDIAYVLGPAVTTPNPNTSTNTG
jgi:hypothetical protein